MSCKYIYPFFQKIFILWVFIFFSCFAVKGQDIIRSKDLSSIKVDQLSDDDIEKILTQINASGLSMDEVEQLAATKGMSTIEIGKLKQRLLQIRSGVREKTDGKNQTEKKKFPDVRKNNSPDSLDFSPFHDQSKRKPLIDSLIFGSELFTSAAATFEPNLNLATPLNYILGPYDEIIISVYGVQQYEGTHKVSPEGNISIPNIGIISVAGLTIENVTEKLKRTMGNGAYPYLKTGASKLSVSLSHIRTIRVNIIGSYKPGNYNLSSLSTVFGALYVAGGPSAYGSFREIELIRNGSIIRKIDLYRYLLDGDQSDNIGLKDNDVIRIPTYKMRVQIEGQVKRQGIFEVLPNENFDKILQFASGFTDSAFTAELKIYQVDGQQRQIMDLVADRFSTYFPKSGDHFVVAKILNRFSNRVKIKGAVFRPNDYSLTQGLHLKDLIEKAQGLREDAYTKRGYIIRKQKDLTESIISFDVLKVMAGDESENKILMREDEVIINSINDLKNELKVIIQGEVRIPGIYQYIENISLKDLIQQAGGLSEAALSKVEISRMLIRDSVSATDYKTSQLISFDLNNILSSPLADLRLMPNDIVTVRKKPGFKDPETVIVSGEVQFPGPYILNSIIERVSSIFLRAGGALPGAGLSSVFLKRKLQRENQITDKAIETALEKVMQKDSSTIKDTKKEFEYIPLDMRKILASPGSVADVILRDGDEIVFPKQNNEVRVIGNVFLPTQIPFEAGYTVNDYVLSAGGYSSKAWKKKLFVVYSNGKINATKHFLFFVKYPKIQPGSEIIIPAKNDRKTLSSGEIIGLSSALASLAGVVIALLRL